MAAAAALVLAGAAAAVHLRSPAQVTGNVPPMASSATPAGTRPMRRTTADHQQQPVAAGVGGTPPAKIVKVGASQKVATVNGTAITGRQLLAWRAGAPAEQEMTAEMFGALRARAIERELTLQEARSKQIELGAAQLDQLKQVRKNAEARGETEPSQLDFEEADARAHLLAAKLFEAAGIAAPFATEADVKRYYEAHASELDELPEAPDARATAWQKIAIHVRQILAVELEETYQQQVRAYFDKLRADARVTDGP